MRQTTEEKRLLLEVKRLKAVCKKALRGLENLTTDKFQIGGDKPIRDLLQENI